MAAFNTMFSLSALKCEFRPISCLLWEQKVLRAIINVWLRFPIVFYTQYLHSCWSCCSTLEANILIFNFQKREVVCSSLEKCWPLTKVLFFWGVITYYQNEVAEREKDDVVLEALWWKTHQWQPLSSFTPGLCIIWTSVSVHVQAHLVFSAEKSRLKSPTL